jgi:hypothetical protein
MNTEKTPEQNKTPSKGEEYLEKSLKEGTLRNIFNEFIKNKEVRKRKLRVIQLDHPEKDTTEKHIKGFANEDREGGAYLTQEDIGLFEQLKKEIQQVPEIEVRTVKDDLTYEGQTYRKATEYNYYISPDFDKFEE